MNATVERIVNLLFEDLVETDETKAMHDEVMNNCQERYASLVAGGYSEDDAIGAVIESLKGMDEVLKDYPHMTDADDGAAFEKHASADREDVKIPLERIRDLQVSVKSADVSILESEGARTLNLEHGERSYLDVRVEGETLVVTQEERETPRTPDAPGRGGLLGAFTRLFSGVAGFSWDECRMTLAVPSGTLRNVRIHTLSGDIAMESAAQTAALESTSGDCRVELDGRTDGTGTITAQSISGDVSVSGDFLSAKFSSTSGDVDFRGKADGLEVSTVSGDVDAGTASTRVKGSTVSGDLGILLSCGDTAEAELSTVSGDIGLRFADGPVAVSARTSTRSGDVEFHNVSLMDDAPVKVRCSSVSGDISIG